MATTTIKLQMVNVLGLPLDDRCVVVDIFSLDNTQHFQATVMVDGNTNFSVGLQDCPGGMYRFELSPTNYQVLQFFMTLPPPDATVVRKEPAVFPVDPAHVVALAAPPFMNLPQPLQHFLNRAQIQNDGSNSSNGNPTGDDLYDGLPPKLKAALLNLYLKSSNTTLPDNSNCFDHLDTLVELDQDRLFATFEGSLLGLPAEDTKDFHSVDFSLHKNVLGHQPFLSFKTRDAEGNLQLTFSRNPDGSPDLVDMDIDEAQGIGHVFEVVRNVFTGLTNPYNIREILTTAQKLRPMYDFVFAEKKTATMAAAAGA